jgi:hypothetical protein
VPYIRGMSSAPSDTQPINPFAGLTFEEIGDLLHAFDEGEISDDYESERIALVCPGFTPSIA